MFVQSRRRDLADGGRLCEGIAGNLLGLHPAHLALIFSTAPQLSLLH